MSARITTLAKAVRAGKREGKAHAKAWRANAINTMQEIAEGWEMGAEIRAHNTCAPEVRPAFREAYVLSARLTALRDWSRAKTSVGVTT